MYFPLPVDADDNLAEYVPDNELPVDDALYVKFHDEVVDDHPDGATDENCWVAMVVWLQHGMGKSKNR
jgi:hypothetical protein